MMQSDYYFILLTSCLPILLLLLLAFLRPKAVNQNCPLKGIDLKKHALH